ncbi:MAG: hypothetical protein KUG82_05940 [Pseudomonadales bacterium]|nr:hypothetical protein [Pseudomonadales bacterium]
MNDEERYEIAKKKAEKYSKELFKPASKEVEEELKNETTLGTPENLVRPDDKQE